MGYSRSKLKSRTLLKVFLILFILLFVVGATILIIASVNTSTVVEHISKKANDVSDDVARNSKPIVIDNVVLGAVYDNEFVSTDKYENLSSNRINTEVDVYTKNGKSGTFKITNMTKKNSAIQALTSSINVVDEYIAIPKSDVNAMPIPPVEVEATDEDYRAVKEALGMYKILNNSINILSVHDISVNLSNTFKIICATSSNNTRGVYSVVIFTNSNRTNSKIIKYNYVKDKNNASYWPIYSFEFSADLNNDGNSEIIIREVSEFNVKYDILEYDNNNFIEVLSSTINLQN